MDNTIHKGATAAQIVVNKFEGKPVDASDSRTPSSTEEDRMREAAFEWTSDNLLKASEAVEVMVNKVAETSLSFSVENELSRMVVSVRSVGSDKVIRQFPPEEFLSVAKFIAAQNPDELSEDFLKGILFDQYS